MGVPHPDDPEPYCQTGLHRFHTISAQVRSKAATGLTTGFNACPKHCVLNSLIDVYALHSPQSLLLFCFIDACHLCLFAFGIFWVYPMLG